MHNPAASLHVRQHRSNMPRPTCDASSQELVDDWHACRSPPRLSVPRVSDLQVKKEGNIWHGYSTGQCQPRFQQGLSTTLGSPYNECT